MSTNPAPLQPPPPDLRASLTVALAFAKDNNDLATVCRGLCKPIDTKRFNDIQARIDRIVVAKRSATSKKKRKLWNSQQNRLKGRLFEKLVGVVLDSCSVFDAHHSVQTSTNELDWLVLLGPFHVFVPVMRTWGTHFICECKMTRTALTTGWVTRLYALTQTHNTRVAVLLTAKEAGNKGNNSRTITAIREYSLIPSPGFILRISLDELITCAVLGQSILEIISEKYMQLALRTDRLRILREQV